MRLDQARRRARKLYAAHLVEISPAWLNTAELILSGWENCWVTPALDALQSLVLLCGDALEEDQEGGST